MMEPHADVVAGFKPVMPTYHGILEEPETAALVEFIKSLQGSVPVERRASCCRRSKWCSRPPDAMSAPNTSVPLLPRIP
jgi:hypothetical protein